MWHWVSHFVTFSFFIGHFSLVIVGGWLVDACGDELAAGYLLLTIEACCCTLREVEMDLAALADQQIDNTLGGLAVPQVGAST